MTRPGIQRVGHFNQIPMVGYGYVVLPRLIDRDDYITHATRNQKVSIMPEEGSSYIHDCYVTQEAFANIIFPATVNNLGSLVVYVTPSIDNKPFVIGVINKEYETTILEERAFRLEKRFGQNVVNITGRAKTGELVINVQNRSGAANCSINLMGSEGSNFNIKCNTKATIYSDQEVALDTSGRVRLKSLEREDANNFSYLDVENNNVTIVPQEKFNVGSGAEPLVLGNELQEQLNNTVSYLNRLQSAISTALSTIDSTAGSLSATPFNSTMSGSSPGDFSDINSETSFTD